MTNSLFIDTLNGIKRERPPVWFMRQAGRVLPSYLKLRETYSFRELMINPELTCEVTLQPVNELGVDAAILFSDILVVPEALGMKVSFTDKGPRFENPLSDPATEVLSLKPDIHKLEHIYHAIDLIRLKKPEDVALIGFCGAPLTTFLYMVEGNSANHTFSSAIRMIYGDRKKTLQIFEIITEMAIEYAVNQVKHGIDAFQLFDTHAGLIPADLYAELALPFVSRITNAVREHNVPLIFFPKDIGFTLSKINHDYADYVSIDWQSSLTEARKLIDGRTGLQGNLDPRLLSVADTGLLDRELQKFRSFGENEYNWIFNTGHGLSPDNKFENVKYVVDWIKNADWRRG